MWVTNAQTTALATVASKFFASLRKRPSHAKVRSTIHLRGRTLQPRAMSERLIISIVDVGWFQQLRAVQSEHCAYGCP